MEDRKIWVEVFDCFYGKKKDLFKKPEPQIPDSVREVLAQLQEMDTQNMSIEDIDKALMGEMGPPSEIVEYTEGNIEYTKKVWDREGEGKFVRIFAKIAKGVDYDDLTLPEKLKIAEQNEDYEEASRLKEEIENQSFIDDLEN